MCASVHPQCLLQKQACLPARRILCAGIRVCAGGVLHYINTALQDVRVMRNVVRNPFSVMPLSLPAYSVFSADVALNFVRTVVPRVPAIPPCDRPRLAAV